MVTVEKNSYNFIALVRHRTGSMETKPYRTEDEYVAYIEWTKPVWATLLNEYSGRVVSQDSFPQE